MSSAPRRRPLRGSRAGSRVSIIVELERRHALATGDLPTSFGKGAPDLAVEVVSPSSAAAGIREKIVDYLDAGTREVWVVEPVTRTLEVYRSDGTLRMLRGSGELDGGDVLPGFDLGVEELFTRQLDSSEGVLTLPRAPHLHHTSGKTGGGAHSRHFSPSLRPEHGHHRADPETSRPDVSNDDLPLTLTLRTP